MDQPKIIDARAIRFEETEPGLRQNAQNQVYFNPPTLAALQAALTKKTGVLGFERLSYNEFALHWVAPGTPGSVKFRWNASRTTAICSFGPVLALRPEIRCHRGRIHQIPFRADLEKGSFTIDLGQLKVVQPERRGPQPR